MKYALTVLLLGLACCGPVLAQDKAARKKKSAELLKEFGDGYKIFTTRHWILVYKADVEWVKSCGKMLERTHDTFVATFEKAGFKLKKLEEDLVGVLIGEEKDFREYMERKRSQSGRSSSPPRGGGGVYSSRTNRITFFDDRTRERSRPGSRSRPAELVNLSKAAHEGAHQLAFNLGVHQRGGRYPPWLVEGLAANFEMEDTARAFGPYTKNLSLRRRNLLKLHERGKTAPLKEFVAGRRPRDPQPGELGLIYSQGWGLFRFLLHNYPGKLQGYLQGFTAEGAERPSPQVFRRRFEKAFGSFEKVEKQWQAFLGDLAKAEEGAGKSPRRRRRRL